MPGLNPTPDDVPTIPRRLQTGSTAVIRRRDLRLQRFNAD